MMDSGISRDAAIQESENYVHYPALGLLRGDLGDHDLYVVTIRCSSFLFLTRIISHLICLPSSHFRVYPRQSTKPSTAILLLHYRHRIILLTRRYKRVASPLWESVNLTLSTRLFPYK